MAVRVTGLKTLSEDELIIYGSSTKEKSLFFSL